MGRERIRKVALVTIWILAVAAAVIFRHVARLTTNLKLSVWLSDGRTAIYFITYIVWGILLRRHVVVRSVKRWLSAIVFPMLFWMIVRTVKFRLPNTSVLGRYLWYSYYLTSVICQLVMISITCCMWSGLIPVNTGYEQFFNGSTLNAQIRRNDASILASSHNSSLLSEQMVRQAMQTGCCIEKMSASRQGQ